MNIHFTDLSDARDYENGCDVGGGYCAGDEVYIDSNLPYLKMRLTLYHEVLEYNLRKRIRHSLIDSLAISLIEADIKLNEYLFEKAKNMPN